VAPLGLIIAWGGYLFGAYGLALWKWSSDPSATKLTISDLALPSHRAAYIAAMTSYAAGGTTSTVGGVAPITSKQAADTTQPFNGLTPAQVTQRVDNGQAAQLNGL
jgi:hypothetical protein